ncbi:hypothetical protein SERLA73DRAFT_188432 [Serpula lacrymans var. lacrymans S7.3]|uniref:Uncharacterized protein n=1 Tax=Serpula lacrymans var. lacrymans (strain S7.3) TaxID=936435 RepID=F8QBB3_SERL3|nr:hypothetical protein SERLA73DRAFT_188432 [Serpula lacrymans var. lacrymans S7.3]
MRLSSLIFKTCRDLHPTLVSAPTEEPKEVDSPLTKSQVQSALGHSLFLVAKLLSSKRRFCCLSLAAPSILFICHSL